LRAAQREGLQERGENPQEIVNKKLSSNRGVGNQESAFPHGRPLPTKKTHYDTQTKKVRRREGNCRKGEGKRSGKRGRENNGRMRNEGGRGVTGGTKWIAKKNRMYRLEGRRSKRKKGIKGNIGAPASRQDGAARN